jgi:hypothetical protein
VTTLKLPEVDKEITRWISLLDVETYKNTIGELNRLIDLWRKMHEKIHVSGSNEQADFIKSFDIMKTFLTREEFRTRNPFSYSLLFYDSIDNLFSRLTHTDKGTEWSSLFTNIGEDSEMLENMKATEDKLSVLAKIAASSDYEFSFYMVCFSFLLAMEGIYDELVRFVFATEQIISGKPTPSIEWLKNQRAGTLKATLRTPSEVFSIWDEGHRIRNAIAHSRFFYNEKTRKMRFVDIGYRNPKDVYDRTLSLEENQDMVRKIVVVNSAFRLLHILLQIHSLLIIPPDRLIIHTQ